MSKNASLILFSDIRAQFGHPLSVPGEARPFFFDGPSFPIPLSLKNDE